ncbi:MAG: tetratricopeptide repeat protein [Elusimicrobiota bacterium]
MIRRKTAALLLGALAAFVLLEAGIRAAGLAFSALQDVRNRTSGAAGGAYRILCLGDSMTAGTYPKMLEEMLNDRMPGRRFAVIDKAQPATLSHFVLANIKRNLDEYRPHMVVVMMGSNDANPWMTYGGLPAEESARLKTVALARALLRLSADKRRAARLRAAFAGIEREGAPICSGHGSAALADCLQDHGRATRAEKVLRDALRASPRDVPALLSLGDLSLRQERYSEASAAFRRALALAPQDARAHAGLGRVFEARGEFASAERSYKKALALDARSQDILADLARFYRARGLRSQVDALRARTPETDPRDTRLAREFCAQSRWDEAEAMFGKALRLDPRSVPAHVRLSDCYAMQGRYPEAEDSLLSAMTLLPGDISVLLMLAQLQLEEGRIRDAKESLRAVLGMDPDDPEAYSSLAECRVREGEFAQAEAAFKKAIELDPRDTHRHLRLGDFLDNTLGDPRRAVAAYQAALRLSPESRQACSRLGVLYGKMRKPELSEQMFRKALRIDPGDAISRMRLAELLMRQGKYDQAAEAGSPAPKGNAPATGRNYRSLRDAVLGRGMKFVCVQYPMRSLRSLEELFDDKSGIVFVDNERSFQEAVRRSGYWDYFIDAFAGDFGHCTPKGYRMIAQNITDAILRTIE